MFTAPETNSSLLDRLSDRTDVFSWARFVRLYSPFVLGYCRKQGLQDADAADVAQEVFAAAVSAFRRFRYDQTRGSFRSWLVTVMRSKLANHFSRRQRLHTVNDEYLHEQARYEERPTLDRQDSIKIRWMLFEEVADEIRPEFRESTWYAFWLTVMQEFTPKEVAGHLGISVQAVYIAKSRVLKRFRQRVRERTVDDANCP